MNLSQAIYRNSVFFFAFVAIAALYGFSPLYFPVLSQHGWPVHIHGALMSLWILMLIGQATLIRMNHRDIHRQVGKLSYALAPIVFVSIATILNHSMNRQGIPAGEQELGLLFSNSIGQPLIFALAYGLAIYHRHDPATHARFMLCTPIPMAGPIFNRVMFFAFDGQITNASQITGYAVIGSLIGLSLWDWFSHRKLNVFPVMLVLVIGLRVFYGLVDGTEMQLRFAEWYMSLPLS